MQGKETPYSHGNRHAMLSDRVHRAADHGNAKADVSRELTVEDDVIGQEVDVAGQNDKVASLSEKQSQMHGNTYLYVYEPRHSSKSSYAVAPAQRMSNEKRDGTGTIVLQELLRARRILRLEFHLGERGRNSGTRGADKLTLNAVTQCHSDV